QTRDGGAVRERDWIALRVAIHLARKKRVRIRGNLLELLARGVRAADVVRRPAACQRIDVAREVFARGPHQSHRFLARMATREVVSALRLISDTNCRP